jgi:hypothetical protein
MTSAMPFIPKSIRHTRRDCEQTVRQRLGPKLDEKSLGSLDKLALSSRYAQRRNHPFKAGRHLPFPRETRIHLAKFLRHAQCTRYFRIRQTGRGPGSRHNADSTDPRLAPFLPKRYHLPRVTSALSVAEDVLAFGLTWLATRHPYAAGTLAAILLGIIVMLTRWVIPSPHCAVPRRGTWTGRVTRKSEP